MKALITGGAGFLGQKLAGALLKDGHEVRLLVRKARPASGTKDELPVTYAVGDLADKASLERACEGMDWVFHAAGLISYNPQKAELMRQTNVVGTRNVAVAALRAKVKRLVFTSSTAAIGVNEDPRGLLNEDSPFNARKLGLAYFDTKFDAERELLKVVDEGLDAVIVNPGSLLGPGDTRRYEKGYVGLVYQYNPLVLFHGGINFVDVDDVVRGHLLALEKGRKGERYILGGENLSFGELVIRINAIIGRPAPKRYMPVALMGLLSKGLRLLNVFGVDIHMTPELVRQVCSWYLYVDSSKAERELGYRPQRIDRAIAGTLDWLKSIGRLK
ncbi:MAG TPA: SDR family oxidoreductase [Bdellovibrionota bacterium]|jgi:dihydroflavonol-4-reductase